MPQMAPLSWSFLYIYTISIFIIIIILTYYIYLPKINNKIYFKNLNLPKTYWKW
nr:ATP synthase F0 subunit 8 [Cylas formicarius]WGU49413.1 ATP synthase F0 subunit 8 [Cylas formicarius]WGU49426.1 ATP synthase F0 subunit 8 [Cylas formicarius]WGU49439.1 ATP synthase F0 subunit 8 [Cylas formicarius]WGU49452.1 ATP synthase F0 subunit 8 [Cylas formicarius]